MLDVDAVVVEIQKSCIICKLYVLYASCTILYYPISTNTKKDILFFHVTFKLYLFNFFFDFFLNRGNGDKIIVAKNSRYPVKLKSVVTVAEVATKKLQSTHVHKLIRVRHDLLWQDVVKKR